jgi:hypothetical protein
LLRQVSHNLNLLSGFIDSPPPSSQTNLNQPGLPNPLAIKADMDEKIRNEIASSIDMLLNQAVRKEKLNAYLALGKVRPEIVAAASHEIRKEDKLPTLKPPEHMRSIVARLRGVVLCNNVNTSQRV